MIPSFQSIAVAGLFFATTAAAAPAPTLPDTIQRAVISAPVTEDTVLAKPAVPDSGATVADRPHSALESDTIPRRRVAVQYSDAYGTRVTIHRRLSYAMVPLFAVSYFTGDKLFKEGSNASSLTRNLHGASATSVAALFTVNTVLGTVNLWQGRHDPIDRKRKLIHATLIMAANAGFTYAGSVLADEAETSLSKRQLHRNINLASMGLSVGSALFMLVGHD